MPDALQRIFGFVASVLTLPLAVALMVAVRRESPGPAIYRAERVGADGRTFTCYKLRTMHWQPAAPGAGITRGGDRRITRLGRVLRATRMDELPQLWNVWRGDMRLVGPRPEDPRYVDFAQPLHREVFTARPGITGLTQLVFADEARLLDPADPEASYVRDVLPAKLRYDAAYLRHRSTALDLWILAQTPRAVLGRPVELPRAVREETARGGMDGETDRDGRGEKDPARGREIARGEESGPGLGDGLAQEAVGA